MPTGGGEKCLRRVNHQSTEEKKTIPNLQLNQNQLCLAKNQLPGSLQGKAEEP